MKKPILSLSRSLLALSLVAASLTAFTPACAVITQAPDASAGNEQQFASVIDDLPLMPGLRTVADSDVLFVEPHQGRIAETQASGTVSIDDVYNFYRRSLPHLGWKVVDGRTYTRDSERLVLDAHADGKITTVKFSVKPTN